MAKWLPILILAAAICCIGLPNAQATYSISSSVSGDGGYDFKSMVFQLPQNTTATGAELDFTYNIGVDTLNWGEGYANVYLNQTAFATPGYTSQGAVSPGWPSQGSLEFFVPVSEMTLNGGFYTLQIDLETISVGSGSVSAEVDASSVPLPPSVVLFGPALAGIVVLRRRIASMMKR
jgi:hypothetical protein